jgi:hypothetical protein
MGSDWVLCRVKNESRPCLGHKNDIKDSANVVNHG